LKGEGVDVGGRNEIARQRHQENQKRKQRQDAVERQRRAALADGVVLPLFEQSFQKTAGTAHPPSRVRRAPRPTTASDGICASRACTTRRSPARTAVSARGGGGSSAAPPPGGAGTPARGSRPASGVGR